MPHVAYGYASDHVIFVLLPRKRNVYRTVFFTDISVKHKEGGKGKGKESKIDHSAMPRLRQSTITEDEKPGTDGRYYDHPFMSLIG